MDHYQLFMNAVCVISLESFLLQAREIKNVCTTHKSWNQKSMAFTSGTFGIFLGDNFDYSREKKLRKETNFPQNFLSYFKCKKM